MNPPSILEPERTESSRMTTGMIAICPGASVFRVAIGVCGTGLTT